MKTFTKSLALLLALLVAFGVSASAAEPGPEEWDSLPELKLDQATTDSLSAVTTELWYRFKAEKIGLYRFIVTGDSAVCIELYSVDSYYGELELISDASPGNEAEGLIFKGETTVIRVYTDAALTGAEEFTIAIELTPFSLRMIWDTLRATLEVLAADPDFSLRAIWDEISGLFTGFFENVGITGLFSIIGMLPILGIMLGFFFAPFSVGGTLLLVPISILFLPLTLIFSPFMLIQSIKDLFN